MRSWNHGFLGRMVILSCTLALCTPVNVPQSRAAVAISDATRNDLSVSYLLNEDNSRTTIFGIEISLPKKSREVASLGSDIKGFVNCNNESALSSTVANVSVLCSSFSILTTGPVDVTVPYDAGAVPEGTAETEIRLYKVAATGPMAPLESHVDTENKKTVATLSEQAGRYINGVLKAGERPDKPPLSLSGKSLEELQEINPAAGLPLISPPQATSTGDLRLTYPIEFPGSRPNLQPSVKVEYSAQSQGGNIANGWSLSVPMITVETRWGVPLYDGVYETETYLYDGEQLVPETGDYPDEAPPGDNFPGPQSSRTGAFDLSPDAELNLAPLPHRAPKLRSRKKDNARFVLRRDDGLWRFVRHGDTPDTYWWEAWQENPGAEIAKIFYFGRSPGRIEQDVGDEAEFGLPDVSEATNGPKDESVRHQAYLTVGPVTGVKVDLNANPRRYPITRWGLARERDAFGNIVDYDWMATCSVENAKADANGKTPYCETMASQPALLDRDLYLKRIFYSSHHDLEELLLACRDKPTTKGCRTKQGGYQVDFIWSSNAEIKDRQLRSDARSGGLVVSRRLLERLELRFRKRDTENNGAAKPIHLAAWRCSDAFVSYRFETVADPMFGDARRAPRWLTSITKRTPSSNRPGGPVLASAAERAIFPNGLQDCAARSSEIAPFSDVVTRFDYNQPAKLDDKVFRPYNLAAGKELKSPRQLPPAPGLLDEAGGLVQAIHGGDIKSGPYRPTFLGSGMTRDSGGGLYVGLSFGNPQKYPGLGYKTTYSARQDQRELTLIQDVSGDGLNDLLLATGSGRWNVYEGALDSSGEFSFGALLKNSYPNGFRFQYEPKLTVRSSGIEGHAAPGAVAGYTSSSSSSLQTVFMSDMDGDGRVDVITPNGTFYNGSGAASYADSSGFEPASRYIGTQAAFAPSSTQATPKTVAVASAGTNADVEVIKADADNPRYDAVRAWRAPYEGLIWVAGSAYAAAADASFDPNILDPNARVAEYEQRDGLIVAIERSPAQKTNNVHEVRSCQAGSLSPATLTPPQVPSPDLKGTWRIAGSTAVREFGLDGKDGAASYMVSLAGKFAQQPKRDGDTGSDPEAAEVILSLLTPGLTTSGTDAEAADYGDFTKAVDQAVYDWNQKWGNGGAGGTLKFVASSGRLTFSGAGNGVEMKPLLIHLPIVRDEFAENGEDYTVTLASITDTSPETGKWGHVARDQASVTTLIFGGEFTPTGRACLDDGDRDLAAKAAQVLSSIGSEAPMFVSVKEGDTLYFRVNAINNGNADVVKWSPTLKYLFARDNGNAREDDDVFPFEPGAAVAPPIVFSIEDKRAPDIVRRDGTLCEADEARLNLCDIFGRSLVRYRLFTSVGQEIDKPADPVDLVTTAGQFVAPKSGRLFLTGQMSKARTDGPMMLEMAALAAAQPPAGATLNDAFDNASDKTDGCRPGLPGARRITFQLVKKDGTLGPDLLDRLPADAGSFRVAIDKPGSVENGLAVAERDNVCLLLRPMAPTGLLSDVDNSRFWSKDSARLSFDQTNPFAYQFAMSSGTTQQRYLVTPAIERAPQQTARLVSTKPINITDVEKPFAVLGGRSATFLPAVVQDYARNEPRTCNVSAKDDGVYRRFVLPSRSDIIDDAFNGAPIDPGNAAFGRSVASLRFAAEQLWSDGTRSPVQMFPFAVMSKSAPTPTTRAITQDHLKGYFPDALDDNYVAHTESPYRRRGSILQDLRLVKGSRGTAAMALFSNHLEQSIGVAGTYLPASHIGYSVCLDPQSSIQVEASLDSTILADSKAAPGITAWNDDAALESRVLDALVSPAPASAPAAVCRPFENDQILADKFYDGSDPNNNPGLVIGDPVKGAVSTLDRICPIAEIHARYLSADSTIYARSLPVSFETVAHAKSSTARRSTAVEAKSHRGAATLAIRAEGTFATISLQAEPSRLKPLTAFNDLVASAPDDSAATSASGLSTKLLGGAGKCEVGDDGNKVPPGEESAFDEVKNDCDTNNDDAVSSFGNLTEPKAVPLIRVARFAKNGIATSPPTCRGLDQDPGVKSTPLESTEICLHGPDADIWASGSFLSASRVGQNDIEEGLDVQAAANLATLNGSTSQANPSSLPSIAKQSSSKATAALVTIGGTVNWSESYNKSPSDVIDMNGDGFPDLIVNGNLIFTDPSGGLRCGKEGTWSLTTSVDCQTLYTIGQSVRGSRAEFKSASVGYPMPAPTYSIPNPATNGSHGATTSGLPQPEGQDTTQPRFSPFGASVDLGESEGQRSFDVLDMNADGLPDLVTRNDGAHTVRLNLGYAFADPQQWPEAQLFMDKGTTSGAGINASYTAPDGSYGGGLDGGIGTADQNQTMADVNGDGLLDVILSPRSKFLDNDPPKSYEVRFSSGSDMTTPQLIGTPATDKARTFGRTETDRAAAGGHYQYVYMITPWPIPIYFVFNPNYFDSSALTRQPILFRDMNGDNLPDIVVGDGSRSGNLVGNFNFSNETASIFPNGLGGHGLLSSVWLPTNPMAIEAKPVPQAANYSFSYNRTEKTIRDPHHRWVLSGLIVRDGMTIDDGDDVKQNERLACFVYDEGFYDRYERRFLGYGRVDTIDGCQAQKRDIIESASKHSLKLAGVRRTERRYANRTIYEAGLLLEERVFDTSAKVVAAEGETASGPTPLRWTRNQYLLVDTAQSTKHRFVCEQLRSVDPSDLVRDRNLLSLATFGDLGVSDRAPSACATNLTLDRTTNDPSFYSESRRLTPTLVQTVLETRELMSGPDVWLTSALQMRPDRYGRAVAACDLGEVNFVDDAPQTAGALCSKLAYDDEVRPSFTHGGTGGGVANIDQRNRVREILVHEFKGGVDLAADNSSDATLDQPDKRKALRRRTATFNQNNGAMIRLCEFADLGAADLCAEVDPSPVTLRELEEAAQARVTKRVYGYDYSGNLESYNGPLGSRKTFTAKRYRYDQYLRLIEIAEQTSFCRGGSELSDQRTPECLQGVSELMQPTEICFDAKGAKVAPGDPRCVPGKKQIVRAELASAATTIDYRHAVATTTMDTNQNALHRVLDPLGRPVQVFASWTRVGAPCSFRTTCLPESDSYDSLFTAKTQSFRRIMDVAYRPADKALVGPDAVLKRYSASSIYRNANRFTQAEDGAIVLPSRIVADQLGQKIATISAAEVCGHLSMDPARPGCQDASRPSDRYVVSGIVFKDALGRPATEHYALSADNDNILNIAIARPDVSDPRSSIAYDGLDRPLIVMLPDRNAYDFQYRVAASLDSGATINGSARRRHRTEMRNALCVPSAVERDVRGAIRAVIDSYESFDVEFANEDAKHDLSARLGSSASRFIKDASVIDGSSLTKKVSLDFVHGRFEQQVQVCDIARGQPFALATAKSVTAYERDTLGQLTAVNLPNKDAAEGDKLPGPSSENILVAYDQLGRRIAINDPDRGFERIHYDGIGNAVCSVSGRERPGIGSSDLPVIAWTDIASGACPDVKSEAGVYRQTATTFMSTLPLTMTPQLLADASGGSASAVEKANAAKRVVTTTHGKVTAEAVRSNTAGRVSQVIDASGTETKTYDALGRPASTTKAFERLTWKPSEPLEITESYDAWGPLMTRSMRIAVPARDSSPSLSVDETVAYTYTAAGQIAGVRRIDSKAKREFEIAGDFQYDARGNALGMTFGTGVKTRNQYAPASNRLIHATALMGPQTELMPALRFQDITYAYDAAGNVLDYRNSVYQDGGCADPVEWSCLVDTDTAKKYGLLISSTANAFTYDQLNRIRFAEKQIATFSTNKPSSPYPDTDKKEGEPQVYAPKEIEDAEPLKLAFAEKFAFDAAHRMARTQESISTIEKGKPKPVGKMVTATYLSGEKDDPLHAPLEVRRNPESKNDASAEPSDDLVYDGFGRMTEQGSSSVCEDRGFLTWNVDDTLRRQVIRIPNSRLVPSKRITSCSTPYSLFFDVIDSEFDGTGRRVHKQVLEMERGVKTEKVGNKFIIIPKDKTPKFRSETLYADPQLTVMRRSSGSPQAVVHYFAGEQRVASKEVDTDQSDADQLFTYHPHLLTRNVSDVVRGELGKPETSRVHSQTEYAAFGQVFLERETSLSEKIADGLTSRDELGLPQYRFNAKEQDESRLQDFGARFYDGRLAMWLRPDPVLDAYLSGRLGGGVYTTSNLASYGFARLNPISNIDHDGRVALPAALPVLGWILAVIAENSGSIALGTAITIASIREKERQDKTTYITYVKYNPELNRIYVGRASGEGTPQDVMNRRDKEHEQKGVYSRSKGWRLGEIENRQYSEIANSFREQGLIYIFNETARHGGTAANRRDSVGLRNKDYVSIMERGMIESPFTGSSPVIEKYKGIVPVHKSWYEMLVD